MGQEDVRLVRFIEWRARTIHDPVKRLQYLRKSMSAGLPADLPEGFPQAVRRKRPWKTIAVVVFAASLLIPAYTLSRAGSSSIPQLPAVIATGADFVPNVWLVDQTADFELYSNGLRIEKKYTQSNEPRGGYPVWVASNVEPARTQTKSQPAGIVFHTTESLQEAFVPDQNKRLQLVGNAVLELVKRNRSYHYVIDRFGRIFRIVPESDSANHAGSSVWADERFVYVNLNTSFIGVAFETQTDPGQDFPSANTAQVHSARVLTQMLRDKYHIEASDCVTHAQVSVNSSNMLIGYHTDWAGNFPFMDVGLKDSYATPTPSIETFGFTYDASFVKLTGSRLWEGLLLAEDQVRAQAAAQGIPVPRYRAILQKKYKEILEALKSTGATKEKGHEI